MNCCTTLQCNCENRNGFNVPIIAGTGRKLYFYCNQNVNQKSAFQRPNSYSFVESSHAFASLGFEITAYEADGVVYNAGSDGFINYTATPTNNNLA